MNDLSRDWKFVQFSDSVERCLRGFEDAKEWQDIISCLAKLHRALLAYPQYSEIPHQLAVCKRLSQCILPGLPGGIHLKVTEVYVTIFKRLGREGLTDHISTYLSGLLPLLSYSSMHVRPVLLDLYQEYFLPLGQSLTPALQGFLLGTLPGLEENLEQLMSKRVLHFLDRLLEATDDESFHSALWSVLGESHAYRFQALLYVNHRLRLASKELLVTPASRQDVVLSLCAALRDTSVLVLRFTLDITAQLFPFHAHSPLRFNQQTKLLTASLQVLLHRDVSLQRRLFSWLEGPDTFLAATDYSKAQPSTAAELSLPAPQRADRQPLSYYCMYSCQYLKSVLSALLVTSGKTLPPAFPLKAVHVMLGQRYFKRHVFDDLFPDIFLFAASGFEAMKTLDKGVKVVMDFLFSTRQVLHAIGPEYVFQELHQFLTLAYSAYTDNGDASQISIVLKLYTFSISEKLWDASSALHSALYAFICQFMSFLKLNFSNLPPKVLVKCLSILSLIWQELEKVIERLLQTPASSPSSLCLTEPNKLGQFIPGNVEGLELTDDRTEICDSTSGSSESPSVNAVNDQTENTSRHADQTPEVCNHKSGASFSTAGAPLRPAGDSLNTSGDLINATDFFNTSGISEESKNTSEDNECASSECEHISGESESTTEETEHTTGESEHTSGESENTTGEFENTAVETDHTTGETDHTTVETDHTTVETEHTTGESEHTTVETDHTTGETDHTTVKTDHTTGETEHTTGESEHTTGETELIFGESEHTSEESKHTSYVQTGEKIECTTRECASTSDCINVKDPEMPRLGIPTPSSNEACLPKNVLPHLTHASLPALDSSTEDILGRLLHLYSILFSLESDLSALQPTIVTAVFSLLERVLFSPCCVERFCTLFAEAHRSASASAGRSAWFSSLVRCCAEGSTGPAVARVALPSLGLYCQALTSARRAAEARDGGAEELVALLRSFEQTSSFYRNVTSLLWAHMAAHPSHAQQCALVLPTLHALLHPLPVCEDVLLERLEVRGPHRLGALQLLTAILDAVHVEVFGDGNLKEFCSRPFRRCVLEVLSALLSRPDPSYWMVREWTSLVLQGTRSSLLLEPVLLLLVGAGIPCPTCLAAPNAKQPSGCVVDQARTIEVAVTAEQCKPLSSLLDCNRVLFAIALVNALLRDFPALLITALRSFKQINFEKDSKDTSSASSSSPRCSLELLLVSCSQFLWHDYCPHALATMEDQRQLLEVKVAILNLLSEIVQSFAFASGELCTSSALLSHTDLPSLCARCKLQHTLLSIVSQFVEGWSCTNGETCGRDEGCDLTSPHCLLLPALHTIHSLSSFENSLSNKEVPRLTLSKLPSSIGSPFPLFEPNRTIVRQKLLWSLVLSLLKMCADSYCMQRRESLSPAVCCFLLTLFTSLKDDLPAVLPTILLSTSAILKSASVKSVGTSCAPHVCSALSSSHHHLVLLSFLPVYYRMGFFEEFGCEDAFCDFHTRVFLNPYISQWKNHLTALGEERKKNKSSLLSKAPQSAAEHKTGLSWLLAGLFKSTHSDQLSAGAAKPQGSLPNALIRTTPKVLESVVLVWKQFYSSSTDQVDAAVSEDLVEAVRRTLVVLSLEPDIFVSIIVHLWIQWTSQDQQIYREVFVEMLQVTGAVPLEQLLDHIKGAVVALGQPSEDSDSMKQEYLVHFLYKYMSSSFQPVSTLTSQLSLVIKFFTDVHSSVPHYASLCLLACALHAVVCRCSGAGAGPAPTDRARKDLGHLSRKLCESLSRTAGVSVAQGFVWIHRNNITPVLQHVASRHGEPVGGSEEERRRREAHSPDLAQDELQKPTIQALAVLSNVLPHFLDLLYSSVDKDVVVSHLKSVFSHLWSHMADHSPSGATCHYLSVQLLSGLCHVDYLFKAWKKEAFECFLNKDFFAVSVKCLTRWKCVIDNLFTQDRALLNQLIGGGSGLSGLSHMFSSSQESTDWVRAIKSVAFVLFAGEKDQYSQEMPEIRKKLFECLQHHRTPEMVSVVLLCFQVLLVRSSYSSLKYVWPTLVYELMSGLQLLHQDVQESNVEPERVPVYLGICRLLELLHMLSTADVPQFHFLKWSFSTSNFEGPLAHISQHFLAAGDTTPTSSTSAETDLSESYIGLVKSLQTNGLVVTSGEDHAKLMDSIHSKLYLAFASPRTQAGAGKP